MDIKHIFSRNKQSGASEKKTKTARPSTAGAHELFLEYEGFLSPPAPRATHRHPAPASRREQPHATALHTDTTGNRVGNTCKGANAIENSRTSCDKPQRNAGSLRQVIEGSDPSTKTTPSWRKKGLFALNRPPRVDPGDYQRESKQSSPLHTQQQENVVRSPSTGWLRRCMSTASRTPQPTPPPSFRTVPSYYGFPNHEDDSLTALPSLPDYEDELPPKPTEKLPSGTAARAAVAAQSEISDPLQNLRLAEPKLTRDSESGVGIEVRDRGVESPDPEIPVVRKDPLSVLPEELIGQILSHLDAVSLVNAELVSSNWHQSASSHHVWKDVFLAEYQDKCQTITAPKTGRPGLGKASGRQDWKLMWQARKALEQRWREGHAAAIYLEGHNDSVYCVQFDQDKILTGSRDRTVRIWDARTFECIKILGLPSGHSGPALPPLPAYGPDRGRRPFTKIFSPPSKVTPTAISSNIYHTGSILCLQYDDQIMITGSSDRTLIVWEVWADYKPTMRLRAHTMGVLDVCFNDKHIVSCSKDSTICLWDRKTGNLLRRMTGHRGPVNAVQMRGDLVVSASGDGIAKLWNIQSGFCIKEFPSRDRGMACVEFSPDSRTILAGGNDQVIYQFDTSTGELVRELKGHEGLVRSLHLDSACGRVVSGSYDTSVKAYDLRTGESIVNFTKWTSSWILSAKSDYRRIIATSQDSRAVIMDFGFQLPGIESLEA